MLVTITGASQDLTSFFQPLMPLLPTGGGGGGGGGGITGATPLMGLTQTGTTLGLQTSCAVGQYLIWSGTNWACATPGGGGPGGGTSVTINGVAAVPNNIDFNANQIVPSGNTAVQWVLNGNNATGYVPTAGGGSMTWPATAGIANYSGSSSWGSSYNAGSQIPANFIATPVASASALSGTPTLCPSGQAAGGILSNGNATQCAAITGGPGGGLGGTGTAGQFGMFASAATINGNANLTDSGSSIVSLETVTAPQFNINGASGAGLSFVSPGGTLPTLTAPQGGIGIGPGGVPQMNVSGAGWINIPQTAGGAGGVASINGSTGAFTFGAGSSCSGTSCTFPGTGGTGSTIEVNGTTVPSPVNFIDSSSLKWTVAGSNVSGTASGGGGGGTAIPVTQKQAACGTWSDGTSSDPNAPNVTATTLTVPITINAGDTVMVAYTTQLTTTPLWVIGLSDTGGNTYSAVIPGTNAGANRPVAIYRNSALGAANAATSVTLTRTTGSGKWGACVATYSGVMGMGNTNIATGTAANGTANNLTVTQTAATNVLFGGMSVVQFNAQTTLTPTAPTVALAVANTTSSNSVTMGIFQNPTAVTGTYTMTVTPSGMSGTGNPYDMAAVELVGGGTSGGGVIANGSGAPTCAAESTGTTSLQLPITINVGDTVLVGVAAYDGYLNSTYNVADSNSISYGNPIVTTSAATGTLAGNFIWAHANATQAGTYILISHNVGSSKFVGCVKTYTGVASIGLNTNISGAAGSGTSILTNLNGVPLGHHIFSLFTAAAATATTFSAGSPAAGTFYPTTSPNGISTTAGNTASGVMCDNSADSNGLMACNATMSAANAYSGAGVELIPGSSGGGGTGAGVTSINGVSGPFTFNGAGQSCSSTTCTFSGGGTTGITGPTANGGLAQTGQTLGLLTSCPSGDYLQFNSGVWGCATPATGGGMTWPSGAAGIPNYSGSSSWGTTYNASNTIPANFVSVLNQSTTGNAATATTAQLAGALNTNGTANQVWSMNPQATGQGWATITTGGGSGTVGTGTPTQVPVYSAANTIVGSDMLYISPALTIGGTATLTAPAASTGILTFSNRLVTPASPTLNCTTANFVLGAGSNYGLSMGTIAGSSAILFCAGGVEQARVQGVLGLNMGVSPLSFGPSGTSADASFTRAGPNQISLNAGTSANQGGMLFSGNTCVVPVGGANIGTPSTFGCVFSLQPISRSAALECHFLAAGGPSGGSLVYTLNLSQGVTLQTVVAIRDMEQSTSTVSLGVYNVVAGASGNTALGIHPLAANAYHLYDLTASLGNWASATTISLTAGGDTAGMVMEIGFCELK
jgi:hypothetical protein